MLKHTSTQYTLICLFQSIMNYDIIFWGNSIYSNKIFMLPKKVFKNNYRPFGIKTHVVKCLKMVIFLHHNICTLFHVFHLKSRRTDISLRYAQNIYKTDNRPLSAYIQIINISKRYN